MFSFLVLTFVNSKIMMIFIFVTIIVNFCNSDYKILKNPFVILTDFEINSFDYQWIDEPSKKIKETVCESIEKATMVFANNPTAIQRNFSHPAFRIGEKAHHGEFSALWEWKNSTINLFPCEWKRLDKQKVWFYFTMATANSLKCYILFINLQTLEDPFLHQVGVAMEFLNLEALSDGYPEFKMMISNYKPRRSLLEGHWLEASPFHTIKSTRLEDYYLNLRLCATVAKTFNKLENNVMLRAIPQYENVLLLLADSSSNSSEQDLPSSSNSPVQPLLMDLLKCEHYLSVYHLIRHPGDRTMLFVIYTGKIYLLKFTKHIHNSYKW